MAIINRTLPPVFCAGAFLVTSLIVGCSPNAGAQDIPFTAIYATGGEPLHTAQRQVIVPPAELSPVIKFWFGFATDEMAAPGEFHDSFSLALLANDSGRAATLVTADTTSFQWLPNTPGGVTISPVALVATGADFPSLTPVLSNRRAFEIEFAVPLEFAGEPVTFYFDLFDNQNDVLSYGFFSELVVIPEPSTGVLLVCGSLVGVWLIKKRKRHLP